MIALRLNERSRVLVFLVAALAALAAIVMSAQQLALDKTSRPLTITAPQQVQAPPASASPASAVDQAPNFSKASGESVGSETTSGGAQPAQGSGGGVDRFADWGEGVPAGPSHPAPACTTKCPPRLQ